MHEGLRGLLMMTEIETAEILASSDLLLLKLSLIYPLSTLYLYCSVVLTYIGPVDA